MVADGAFISDFSVVYSVDFPTPSPPSSPHHIRQSVSVVSVCLPACLSVCHPLAPLSLYGVWRGRPVIWNSQHMLYWCLTPLGFFCLVFLLSRGLVPRTQKLRLPSAENSELLKPGEVGMYSFTCMLDLLPGTVPS